MGNLYMHVGSLANYSLDLVFRFDFLAYKQLYYSDLAMPKQRIYMYVRICSASLQPMPHALSYWLLWAISVLYIAIRSFI